MKPPPFDYAAPSSLQEALRMLRDVEGAKVLAGGQSLMPILAFRLAAPSLLVDIKNVPGLDRIRIGADGVHLGARVRWVDIEKHKDLGAAHPLLARAISHVAHYQIRNRGTVGGSVCHADPAAEMPGVAVTCDAVMEIASSDGTRHLAANAFFRGPLQTALGDDELLVGLRLPPWPAGRRWAFEEFARRRGDFAIAGALLYYDLDAGRIADAHVGAIGIGEGAQRLTQVEAALNGKPLNDAAIAEAVTASADAVEPTDDIHASADYRRALFGTLLERGLRRSFA